MIPPNLCSWSNRCVQAWEGVLIGMIERCEEYIVVLKCEGTCQLPSEKW